TYSYYPGCSLHGTSKEYDASTQAVCAELEIELKELPDWICCGASSGHSLDEILNIGLPAHTLKLAEREGLDVAVPCAACYNRLKVAEHALKEEESVRDQMKELLDYDYVGTVQILNLVELITDRVGLETVKSKVVKPLTGLKVVCYYGCLLVRPARVTHFDDPEHPHSLDELMEAVGAEVLNWSYKTECCGGSLSLTRDDIVKSLVDGIVDMAKEAGAEAIVTLCPLCLENLEMRQTDGQFPVLYFTELLGVAFGLKESEDWMKKHLIDATPLLKSLQLLS
ncbi:MAG: CoB--CoM heterodisulfide reductase iron-sulfur subunit B family protein, partial [bacterium]